MTEFGQYIFFRLKSSMTADEIATAFGKELGTNVAHKNFGCFYEDGDLKPFAKMFSASIMHIRKDRRDVQKAALAFATEI